jgi:hypothetical protein
LWLQQNDARLHSLLACAGSPLKNHGHQYPEFFNGLPAVEMQMAASFKISGQRRRNAAIPDPLLFSGGHFTLPRAANSKRLLSTGKNLACTGKFVKERTHLYHLPEIIGR